MVKWCNSLTWCSLSNFIRVQLSDFSRSSGECHGPLRLRHSPGGCQRAIGLGTLDEVYWKLQGVLWGHMDIYIYGLWNIMDVYGVLVLSVWGKSWTWPRCCWVYVSLVLVWPRHSSVRLVYLSWQTHRCYHLLLFAISIPTGVLKPQITCVDTYHVDGNA